VELIAETANGQTYQVATAPSAPLVVRGRSPGHYADHHERYNPMGVTRSASHHGALSTPSSRLVGNADLGISSFPSYSPAHYGGSATTLGPLGGKLDMPTGAAAGNSIIMSPATPNHLAAAQAGAGPSSGYPFPPMMVSDVSASETPSDLYNSHDSLSVAAGQHQLQMTSPITPSASGGAPYDDHNAAAVAAAAAAAAYQSAAPGAPMTLALTPSTSGYGAHLPSIAEVSTTLTTASMTRSNTGHYATHTTTNTFHAHDQPQTMSPPLSSSQDPPQHTSTPPQSSSLPVPVTQQQSPQSSPMRRPSNAAPSSSQMCGPGYTMAQLPTTGTTVVSTPTEFNSVMHPVNSPSWPMPGQAVLSSSQPQAFMSESPVVGQFI
jgi:hypothetical protein